MVNFYANTRSQKDGCPYAKPRKKYTRTHPPKTGFKQEKHQPRIKATIIKLTKLGYTINQLSNAFCRSTSFIHKCVRTAITRKITHYLDKRKLPNQTRLRCSSIRRKTLSKYIIGWLMFAKGELDRPP